MRHLLCKPAEAVKVACAGLVHDGTGGKEQQTLEDGVVHRVVKSCGEAERRGKANRREHVAYLGNTVEREQTLEVMLRKRHGHAHQHTHTAEEDEQELHRPLVHDLKQEIAQADDRVKAGLCKHARNEQRHRRGSRAMGVRRERMERHDESLCREARKQQREGYLHSAGAQHARQQHGQLREVQRMRLGIEHHYRREDERRADGADDKVLERRLKSALALAAVRRQADRAYGEYLHHDIHIEDIARQHHAENAAGCHKQQRVILHLMRVMGYIVQAVKAGGKGRDTDEQPEEQAQRVDLYRDAYRVAAGDAAVAEPVGDYLSVYHYRLYERDQAGKAQCRRDH